MASYVSLFNETIGDFDSVNINNANIINANIDNAAVINATITNENVQNSSIHLLTIGGQIKLPDGTVVNPSLTFTNETDLGFYRSGSGEITFVNNGLPLFKISPTQSIIYSDLISDYQFILNDLSANALLPTLNFFDIGLGIYRSNPDVLSISSEGFQIVDINSLSLKVNGLIEANSANITGAVTIGSLNIGSLNVTGTSSFGSTMTCSGSVNGNAGFLARLGTTLSHSYGFATLSDTFIYATAFPSIMVQVLSSSCMEFKPTIINIFKNLNCSTNTITCGAINPTSVNTGAISCSSINNSGTFSNTSSATIGSLTTTSISCSSINNSGTFSNTSSATIGSLTTTSINNSGTFSSTSSATIGSLTSSSISNTGTFSSTSSATIGSLTTTSINNSGTFSNTSSATMGALTTTSINCSGTLAAGTTKISGTLQTTGTCYLSVGTPNTNSTNNCDVYGTLGMSLANSNTFYAINTYYSGGWRPIRNGYSSIYRLDGSGGGLSIGQTAFSNTADSLVTMNDMMRIALTGDTQIFGNFNAPSCYLTAQPMLMRDYGGTPQTIPTGSAQTMNGFSSVIINQGATVTYSGGIFTVPLAGTYYFECRLRWVGNSTGIREIYLINATTGVTFGGGTVNCSGNSRRVLVHATGVVKCSAGDQFAANIYQNSGGDLDIQDTGSDRISMTVLRLH